MSLTHFGIAVFTAIPLLALWRTLEEHSERQGGRPVTQAVTSPSLPRSQADVQQLLQQMSDSLRTRLQSAGMTLDLKLPAHALPVLLDRSGMQEVFANIVELACRVMHAGSTLQVLGRIDGVHAVVNFMDTAPDIDEPRLARCFSAASTRSARKSGDGESIASVALCTHIVAEHRGRIYAAPSPLGSLGITLRLPLQGAVAGPPRTQL